MKKIFLFSLILGLGLRLSTHAITVTDDFRQKDEIPNAVYINLSEISQGYRSMTGWLEAPDNTAYRVQTTKQPGAAIYYVTGVKEIEIDIYSRYGTFAVTETSGQSGLGFGIKDGLSISLPRIPLYISDSEIYASYDKGWYKMLLNLRSSQYEFVPASAPENTEKYGISAYSSYDGTSLNELNIKQTSLMSNSLVTYPKIISCFERYTAQVPASTKYIMIYLNDFYKTETTSGTVLPQESGNRICLAAVRFKGDSISFKLPVPEPSSIIKGQESSSKGKSETQKQQTSKSASKSSSRQTEKTTPQPSKADDPNQSRYDSEESQSWDDDYLRENAQQVFSEADSRKYEDSDTHNMMAVGIVLIIGGSVFLAWRIITIFFVKKS